MESFLFFFLLCVGCVGLQDLGCFRDVATFSERAMNDALLLDDSMTPAVCTAFCAQQQCKFAGLQFGLECWCSRKDDYDKYGALDSSQCVSACNGNHNVICGGSLALTVLPVTEQQLPAVSSPRKPPLLALVMIVKDEAHTLASTLLPLKPFIDYYFILDTGSTDGTQQVIRNVLGMNGEIHEAPFVDYGTSRNQVLTIAESSDNAPVFCLMLSADETVYNMRSLRRFLEQNEHQTRADHEAYALVVDVGWKFDSVRVSRSSKHWRYIGKVHEYLASPSGDFNPVIRIAGPFIKFQMTDPERRRKRELKILAILERDKREDPSNPRTAFYLARTYNALGNHSAALLEFERRLGAWREEIYESLFAMAWQKKELGYPWSEVQAQFLQAHMFSPDRSEPLYNIADYYLVENQMSLAFMFALRGSQIPFPVHSALWVQEDIYNWQLHYIIALSAVNPAVRQYNIGLHSLLTAISYKPDNEHLLNCIDDYRIVLGADSFQQLVDGELIKLMHLGRINNRLEELASPDLLLSDMGRVAFEDKEFSWFDSLNHLRSRVFAFFTTEVLVIMNVVLLCVVLCIVVSYLWDRSEKLA